MSKDEWVLKVTLKSSNLLISAKPRWLSAGLFSCDGVTGLITENLLNRVTTDPDICHGNRTARAAPRRSGPSFVVYAIRRAAGAVESRLELLASGVTHQKILDDYKDLEGADLLACLLLAAQSTKVKHISWLVG